MPKVSVIIPTYNRSIMLEKAIFSVLRQTYQDFEIIVVDDGSVDNTYEQVCQINDSRLFYHYQPNSGLAAARNTGLCYVRGEFVAFLDDDDTFLPHKLEVQVKELEANPEIGLIAGGWLIVDQNDRVILKTPPQQHINLGVETWLLDCPFIVHAPLIRKEWIDRTGGFDTELRRAEDWSFWLNLAYRGCKMQWGSEIVCTYTQHDGTMVRVHPSQMSSPLRMLEKFFAQPNLSDSLMSLKDEAFARMYLSRTVRWISQAYYQEAEEDFRFVIQYQPEWSLSNQDELLELLVNSARNPTLDKAANVILEDIIRTLPYPLKIDKRFQRDLRVRFELKELLEACASKRWIRIRNAFIRLARRDIRKVSQPWLIRMFLISQWYWFQKT